MKTSSLYALNVQDFLKGLLVAVISSVLVVLQSSLDAGNLKFNWHAIAVTATAAGVGYLLKNFFTPAQIVRSLPAEPQSAKA